jgi:hypothetical protein
VKSKIVEITMENELLRERARRADAGHRFVIAEVEALSQTIPPSADKPYGLACTCAVQELAHSTEYAVQARGRWCRYRRANAVPKRPGTTPG